jgi:hypothetical protein
MQWMIIQSSTVFFLNEAGKQEEEHKHLFCDKPGMKLNDPDFAQLSKHFIPFVKIDALFK